VIMNQKDLQTGLKNFKSIGKNENGMAIKALCFAVVASMQER